MRLAGGKTRLVGGETRLAGGKTRLAGGKTRLAGGEARLAGGKARLAGGEARDTFCIPVRSRGLNIARFDYFIYAHGYKFLSLWRNSHALNVTHFSNIGALDFGTCVRPGMD